MSCSLAASRITIGSPIPHTPLLLERPFAPTAASATEGEAATLPMSRELLAGQRAKRLYCLILASCFAGGINLSTIMFLGLYSASCYHVDCS